MQRNCTLGFSNVKSNFLIFHKRIFQDHFSSTGAVYKIEN